MMRTEGLELSTRVKNVFKILGINEIRDLENFSESDFLKIPNFGSKSLREVRWLANSNGISLERGVSLKCKPSVSQRDEKILEDYKKGSNFEEIAKKYQTSVGVVSHSLRKFGIRKSGKTIEEIEKAGKDVRLQAWEMRQQGFTLKEIGLKIGRSTERVRQILYKHERYLAHPLRKHLR